MNPPDFGYFSHSESGLMHKNFFAAQQKASLVHHRLKLPTISFKSLNIKEFLDCVHFFSNPVRPLIFKAWRSTADSYQQSYPQKIWASSTSVYESMT
jgi:hypothetical protein